MTGNLDASSAGPGSIWIDDPDAPGHRVRVRTMTRGDVVGQMFARGAIDETQRTAGARLAVLFERAAAVGYGSGIDLSRERVDGGGAVGDAAADAMEVARQLTEARAVVGVRAYDILRAAISEGATFVVISRRLFGVRSKPRVVADMIRLALEDLAVWWGLAGGDKAERRRTEMRAVVGATRPRKG